MIETYPKNYFNIYFAGMKEAAEIESTGRPTNNGYSTELCIPKKR